MSFLNHGQPGAGHRQFISDATRGNSPTAAGALAQGGGGRSGMAAYHPPTIISDRGGEVSHVSVRGGQVFDPFTAGINQISGWAEVGSVPRVVAAAPPGCDGRYLAEGVGSFSLVNYFSLPVPNALDFRGDFTLCVIYATPSTALQELACGGVAHGGWELDVGGGAFFETTDYVGDGVRVFGSGFSTGVVNVIFAGRAGTTQKCRFNLGVTSSASALNNPAQTAATLGLDVNRGGNSVMLGTLYEIWAAAITPSDALFTSIALEVKGRLGVTAW